MITKKQILCLIALAIILVIVSVACSGNPTNAGDYIVAKQVEQSPQPEKKLTIDTNQGLIQFKDLSFKSGAYYINGNYTRKIYYYADIKVDENSKPYISAITKSEDGEIIEEEGKFYETTTNGSGEFYNLEGVRYQSGNKLTAEVTFNESGYLVIRFSNYSLDITYSLTEKATEGGSHSKAELEGTWKSSFFLFTIDNNGNMNFNCGLTNTTYPVYHYNYSGKIADNFEYPYTVELTFTVSSHASTSCKELYLENDKKDYEGVSNQIENLEPKSQVSKFTFLDASTCISSNLYMAGHNGSVYWYLYSFNDDKNVDGNYRLKFESFKKQ